MCSSISYHMVADLDKQCFLFLSFEKVGKLLHKKSFLALWNKILRIYSFYIQNDPFYILFFMWLHLYAGNSTFLLDEIFLGRFCYCIEYCSTSGSVVCSLTDNDHAHTRDKMYVKTEIFVCFILQSVLFTLAVMLFCYS